VAPTFLVMSGVGSDPVRKVVGRLGVKTQDRPVTLDQMGIRVE